MQDIYSAILFTVFAAVTAAAVGSFFLYLHKDQIRYRKEKVYEALSKIGATEINVYLIESPISFLDRFPVKDIYHVEYKNVEGIKCKTEFLFSNVNSDIKWKDKP